jgi:transcriptional regulator with XRE-family HTH domain
MDSFGSRLRYERERRQIALKSIAESTKIGITLLEGLERDDVSRWPSGIFRKSFIRSYADAIGLDADEIVREFVERHPDPLEVEIPAPPAVARSSQTSHGTSPQNNAPPPSGRPLAIKLTITWSGSLHHTITRLVGRKIGRLRTWNVIRKLRRFNLGIFQPANLDSPTQHVSGVAARDQVPPA